MNNLLLQLAVALISFSAQSQIAIDNTSYSITNLVDGILVPTGSGTAVSNVQFRGCLNISNRYQAGFFANAGTTEIEMGFTSGVVLSTGNTADIPLTLGVNPGSVGQMSRNYTSGTAGEIRSSNAAAGQDADIDNLITPENYYNGAVLEFDFIPLSNEVSFRYVFGSEEYDDQSGGAFAINYNCSGYNDKFAFLISGSGISGGQGYLNDALNIAQLPNGSQVGINSVNNGFVGSSGGSPNAGNCTSANAAWLSGSPTLEFNGFIDGTELNGSTNALIASYSSLVPGQVYHIRLLLADAKDGAYDSVVYLESGSFTTDPGSLPVEFISFNGECTSRGNQLNWQTASEANNDYFIVEESTNGTDFIELATIQGAGNAQSLQSYSYLHSGFNQGTSYYRLSQVDYDGKLTVLKIITVSNDCLETTPTIISSYSPAMHSIDLHANGLKGIYTIQLYNSLGEVILLGETPNLVSNDSFSIKLDNSIASGVYSIHLAKAGEFFVDRVLIL
jgi:hypothetical protein